MQNFVYLWVDSGTRQGVVIDSGWEVGPIVEAAMTGRVKVKFVVATHGHFDHVGSIDDLAKELGAEVVAHESSEIRSDVRVKDSETLSVGDSRLKIIHTPGHSIDSVCLFDDRLIFTGDTLFVGTIGRLDSGEESTKAMYHSLHEKILKLPPSTVFYPGHDYGEVPSRSLADEAKANPYLLVRDYHSFRELVS